MAYIKETRENEPDELLRTHYYKTSYEKIREELYDYLPKQGYSITKFNDDYGEAMAYKGRLNVTIKIIMQNPRETSVDFFFEYNGLFGSKKVAAFLIDIYNHLAKTFEFKGLGLHQ